MLREIIRMMKQEQEEAYVTAREAEKITGLTEETLRKYKYAGKLTRCKSLPSGRAIKYNVKELEGLYDTNNYRRPARQK